LDSWTGFDLEDASVADQVVAEHWNFWSSRV
jgi:hypothetical protein